MKCIEGALGVTIKFTSCLVFSYCVCKNVDTQRKTQDAAVTASIMNVVHVFMSPSMAAEQKLVHGIGAENSLVAFRSPLLIYSPLHCLFSPVKDSCQKPACYEKTVTLTKEPYDSLGMTVAGGMSSRGWDLPIYVTNVDSDGVVGQEGSIRKGNNELLRNPLTSLSITYLHTQSYNVIIRLLLLCFITRSVMFSACANNYSFSGWSICFTRMSSSGAHIMAGRLSWI